MSNLVKIRGLSRGAPNIYDSTTASGVYGTPGGAGPASVRGFRIKSAIGRQYNFETASVAATLASGTGGGVTWTASYDGTYGNNIQVAIAAGSAGVSDPVVVTWQSATAYPLITVNKANTVSGAFSVQQAVNAVNSDPEAAQFVVASCSTTEASVTVGTLSATNLSGGSNGTGTADAEPGPNTGGVAGEPIYVNVTNQTTVVVDTDDQVTARQLQRNRWRWISLGSP